MKKLVLAMIGVVALCVHGATLEETRRLVHEYIDEIDDKYSDLNERLHSSRYRQILSDLRAVDLDIRMSAYLAMIAEKPGDPATVNRMLRWCYQDDGWAYASYGKQEVLDWARNILKSEDNLFSREGARGYLMRKGDARDLDIIGGDKKALIKDDAEVLEMFKGNADVLNVIRRTPDALDMIRRMQNLDILFSDYKTILAMRAAGTNIINYIPISNGFIETRWYGCIPSVTNTGPQGVYVENLLRQYWENMETGSFLFEGESRPLSFKDRSKIPAEIQTLVVWFDEDGNPVCNVDLAKYGLTMPEIDVPNRPKGKPKAAAEPLSLTGDDTQRPEAAATMDTPPNRLWLYAAILSALCACVTLWLVHKKR